jgi:hypothetical protein
VIIMRPDTRWIGRSLPAALLPTVALLAQGCLSMAPWRSCEAPCIGPQFEEAHRVEICKTDGVPYILEHARWATDERGDFVAGRARTRLGQPLGEVRLYADEIDLMWTRRIEGGRIAANAALLPFAILDQAVNGGEDDEEVADQPPSCPTAEPGSSAAAEPAPAAAAAPTAPPPPGGR